MATVVDKLTAQGSDGDSDALNDLVAQLWPNIDVAGSQMIKEIVDPMFKTMLPAPLSSLHFTKVELGNVPIRLTNVTSTKLENGAIELDMNVDWEGKCDIELEADYMPGLGVESVHLHGRMTILLCPITNVLPLIGAAQLAFINPPQLKLDFTGAANVADLSVIDGAVRSVVLDTLNSFITLPTRYLYKLDTKNDYFKTYLHPLGIVRVTVGKAWGFAEEAKNVFSKLKSAVLREKPDCYTKIDVGAEPSWKTTIKNETNKPEWNETHDFVVSDIDQYIKIDVEDSDVGTGDDEVGIAVTTVREIMAGGGQMKEYSLLHKGEESSGRVTVACQFYPFEATNNSFTAADHQGSGRTSGLVTILIASASGIQGKREEIKPSVVVTWGDKNRFQTGVQSDAPGTDISNPAFDSNFRIPITADMVGNNAPKFHIALMNGEKEIGGADVPLADVLKAPDMKLENTFDVGNGAKVKGSICLRGLGAAGQKEQKTALPDRTS